MLTDFDIGGKVRYALTDNASNMKKALTAQFPDPGPAAAGGADPNGDIDVADEDGDGGWQDRGNEEEKVQYLDLSNTDRLSCFAHSLQLVVGDGLKDAKYLTPVISKVTSISSFLHHSAACKVRVCQCRVLYLLTYFVCT